MLKKYPITEIESVEKIKELLLRLEKEKNQCVLEQKYEEVAQLRDKEKKLIARLSELEGL